MKMKKMLAMILAVVMCVSLLAACGDKPSGNQPTDNVIKLGLTGPLTGPYAIYGLAAARGAEIAVAEINAKGGIQFEFQSQDDEGDGEIAGHTTDVSAMVSLQVSVLKGLGIDGPILLPRIEDVPYL